MLIRFVNKFWKLSNEEAFPILSGRLLHSGTVKLYPRNIPLTLFNNIMLLRFAFFNNIYAVIKVWVAYIVFYLKGSFVRRVKDDPSEMVRREMKISKYSCCWLSRF